MNTTITRIAALVLLTVTAGASAAYDPNHFDPDNAAHWYRKAFALYEEPNDIDLDDYIYLKQDLTPEIEQYLKSQQPVIELLTKATAIEHCDWEFDPWPIGPSWIPFTIEARQCCDLLLADARHLDNKQDPSVLIDKIESSLTLAQKVDFHDSTSYLTILSNRERNYAFIQEYLNWNADSPLKYLQAMKHLIERDVDRKYCSNIDLLGYNMTTAKLILTQPDKYFPSDDPFWISLLNPAQNSVNMDFYQKNLRCYENYIQKAQNALKLPYPQAMERIEQIEEELRDQWITFIKRFEEMPEDYKATQQDCDYTQQFDFIFTLYIQGIWHPMISLNPAYLDIQTRVDTKRNALQVAINLLVEYRQTQTIPDTLTPDRPKDLYSDKPFIIIKDMDGFTLKCQGKGLDYFEKAEYNEYRFNIRFVPKVKEKNTYTSDNSAYWYEKAANAIPMVALDAETEQCLRRILFREIGPAADSKLISEIVSEICDGETRPNLKQYIRGNSTSGNEIKDYIKKQQESIECYLNGASIDSCDWEIDPNTTNIDSFEIISIASKSMVDNVHMLEGLKLVIADALITAEQGNPKKATKNMLLAFDICRHYQLRSRSEYSWQLCTEAELLTDGVFHLLQYTGNDYKILSKINKKLGELNDSLKTASEIFDHETQQVSTSLLTGPPKGPGQAGLAYIKKELSDISLDNIREINSKQVQSLYLKSRKELRRTIELAYLEATPQIQTIIEDYAKQAIRYNWFSSEMDLNAVHVYSLAKKWQADYESYLTMKAHLHACQAAARISLVKARTGEFADNLQNSLPNDPFTSEAFEFVKQSDGFILRSKFKQPTTDKPFEWKVKSVERE